MQLSDTSPKGSDVYFERLAGMRPSERLGLGVGLWEAGHAFEGAAVRRRHPDADEADIAFHVAVERVGAEVARAAYRRTWCRSLKLSGLCVLRWKRRVFVMQWEVRGQVLHLVSLASSTVSTFWWT